MDIEFRATPSKLVLDIVGTDNRTKRIETDRVTEQGLNFVYATIANLEADEQITTENAAAAMRTVEDAYGYGFRSYANSIDPFTKKALDDISKAA